MRLHSRLVRFAWPALLVMIVAYGALLRIDAISAKFDPVVAPGWLHRLEVARAGHSVLRPAAMRWDAYPRFVHKDGPPSQYRSDPYTYLVFARQMRSFYAAHWREPLFPFATKAWLWLLHDDDSAVSFAAGAFSVLAIALTFALGRDTFSAPVGLFAALFWAVEMTVVDNGTEGWRDEAFTCAVLLTAWLALRVGRQPTARRAIAFGIACGLACLVRITSLSFIVPALIWLAAGGMLERRARLRSVGLASAVLLIVAGPFVVNCWRVFGDPLYSISVAARVYRETEGQQAADATVGPYLGEHLRTRPAQTIDTIALGMTTYPFTNKWTGFDVWLPALGRSLAVLALIGLFLFVTVPSGRLLLVMLAGSLAPYAATWRLIYDWRFTEHAYPFLLIAASSVPWFVSQLVQRRRSLFADRGRVRQVAAIGGAAMAVVVVGCFVMTRVMPRLVFLETVRAGAQATIMAGDRDGAFFGGEWSRAVRSGAIATRAATGPRATMVVPLAAGRAYDVLLRVDPSQGPMPPGVAPQRIQLLLNGRLLSACDPQSLPERVGICRFTLPADAVRAGTNRMTLVTERPSGFRVWYARVSPAS